MIGIIVSGGTPSKFGDDTRAADKERADEEEEEEYGSGIKRNEGAQAGWRVSGVKYNVDSPLVRLARHSF